MRPQFCWYLACCWLKNPHTPRGYSANLSSFLASPFPEVTGDDDPILFCAPRNPVFVWRILRKIIIVNLDFKASSTKTISTLKLSNGAVEEEGRLLTQPCNN